MNDEAPKFSWQTGDLQRRAVAAASALRSQASEATAPDLKHVALARKLSVLAGAATVALLVGTVLLLSFVASAALPWVVGTGMVLAVTGVFVLGFHAGGHGWFVPLPVLVLAALWAITVSAGSWASPVAWVLAGLAFATALAAVFLILPALAFRNTEVPALGGAALVGASGIALSPLSPTGIARVHNETWTAESLSGPLPVGTPVHVAKVEGLRLLVWSEVGNVPGPEALGSVHQEKEEA